MCAAVRTARFGMRRVIFYRLAVKKSIHRSERPLRIGPLPDQLGERLTPDHSERIARPNHRTPHVGSRGIVKPETLLRLPEVPTNHVFKIGDVDLGVRIEGVGIIHRDEPAGHVPSVPTACS